MELESLVVLLIIGAIAGWLAGLLTKGGGFGLVGNIVVGVIGAFLGTWLFDVLGVSVGGGKWVGPIVTSTVGAIVLLLVARTLKKA